MGQFWENVVVLKTGKVVPALIGSILEKKLSNLRAKTKNGPTPVDRLHSHTQDEEGPSPL